MQQGFIITRLDKNYPPPPQKLASREADEQSKQGNSESLEETAFSVSQQLEQDMEESKAQETWVAK